MEGITDIKISGIDEFRPPRIRKEPYINLFFKLSHKAPRDWCESFNGLVKHLPYPVHIDPAAGLFIETWVRKPDEIEELFAGLKQAVRKCSEEYVARMEAEARAAAEVDVDPENQGEQGRLNRILAGLDYDDA